jgi:hypothetical protein
MQRISIARACSNLAAAIDSKSIPKIVHSGVNPPLHAAHQNPKSDRPG